MAREIVTSETKSKHDSDKLSKKERAEIEYNKAKNYVMAKFKGGSVGGSLKDNTLKINHADLPEELRGKGYGKEMYKTLIDHAHDLGYEVYSDATVEKPAARVYESLKKHGYDVERLPGGGELQPDEEMPHGAYYGKGANSPVYKIHNKKHKKSK